MIVEFLDRATLEEIESALKDGEHHVVHFSGHGGCNEYDSRETGVLNLEDEWGNIKAATGKELAMCLKKFTSIRLVVFSACETAHACESGVVGAMLKEGIPTVLGMRYPVNDMQLLNLLPVYMMISARANLWTKPCSWPDKHFMTRMWRISKPANRTNRTP